MLPASKGSLITEKKDPEVKRKKKLGMQGTLVGAFFFSPREWYLVRIRNSVCSCMYMYRDARFTDMPCSFSSILFTPDSYFHCILFCFDTVGDGVYHRYGEYHALDGFSTVFCRVPIFTMPDRGAEYSIPLSIYPGG